MLDFVVSALVLIVPWLLYSLTLVKFKKNYTAHRNHQIAITIVLLTAVALFEIDMQIHGGWIAIVNKNPDLPRLDPAQIARVRQMLSIHLIFAISTPILWLITITHALSKFPNPPHPSAASRFHKPLAWISVVDLVCTSLTGLIFYYMAFINP